MSDNFAKDATLDEHSIDQIIRDQDAEAGLSSVLLDKRKFSL